ncbi:MULTISPECIES: NAD(P)/FAD-dependent oxidoreductase [unclassified Wenzhouxiangella]|uniref:NAD(P)/FAD-dependent oxidoreductase n=1 Tax=unclassified Wenzhouxiangella TaxID=2613841 RepID=UPI000E32C2E9|nr:MULTISPECIES: FAD-dependent oxidoreductase [unclassified Wenzhouxiangella]RFF28645.1 NAD(P)/FAD-dependent oxidoreductase [Wenzhouxiangella sp. 15181]RFP68959.1 NAD(P)/FAD-dependent oxidoreductase [Wenzhouxiangella sp. 15190]
MSRVTIIGSGFAALTAVRNLRNADPKIGIDLVSPRAELVYYPGTIWIPTGKREPEDLVVPLDRFFERMRVTHHPTHAIGLSEDGRTVRTESGELANDGLIIACGGQFLKKLPGIEHSILPCGGPQEITRLRDRLHAMESGSIAFGFAGNPNEPSAMRGGPVFEFLFGIDTWLRKQDRRDRFTLHFFSPAEKPGQRLGGKAVDRLLEEMQKRGIRTHLGRKPKRFSEDGVETETERFAADLILFMPGMTGNDWFDETTLPRSDGGMIRADRHCRVDGFERVYVAGDAGSFPGPGWMPKQAHMADLQAEAAAKNMLAELAGKPVEATFKSELMCIVDQYDRGILVTRSEKANRVLPPLRAMHWAKRLFEWRYLRQYR